MSTEFVIVVEVDNKRALAAYTKGLEDLDLVMPQLLAAAQETDRLGVEAIQRRKEESDRLFAEREEQLAKRLSNRESKYRDYETRLRQWRNSCSWMRGAPPEEPAELVMSRLDLGFPPYWPRGEDDFYRYIAPDLEIERNALIKMRNLAGAATAPFRMLESQVHEMIAWEDGTAIERLKKKYLRD